MSSYHAQCEVCNRSLSVPIESATWSWRCDADQVTDEEEIEKLAYEALRRMIHPINIGEVHPDYREQYMHVFLQSFRSRKRTRIFDSELQSTHPYHWADDLALLMPHGASYAYEEDYEEDDEEDSDCPACDGKGETRCYACRGSGIKQEDLLDWVRGVPCPTCSGEGKELCSSCFGRGH